MYHFPINIGQSHVQNFVYIFFCFIFFRNKIFHMKVRQKRQTMQNMTRPLKQWLCDHRGNPYPTKTEKDVLATASRMTMVQVSNWFANARRRLKSAVQGDNLSWSKRVKLYNSNVTGNAELLSVSSDDSLFDSDEGLFVHHFL